MAAEDGALMRVMEELTGDAVPRQLRSGTLLFLAGDPAGRVHLVRRGVVKLVARDLEGDETIVGLALPGEIVGDVSALGGFAQPVDAIAATDCVVAGVRASILMDRLSREPAALRELGAMVAERLRWTLVIIAERVSGDVPLRLAGRLLDLGARIGEVHTMGTGHKTIDLELPMDQKDLGNLAGMCRESACKTLRSFRRDGLLDYRGRRLRILRPDLLERIRCGARYEGGRATRASEPSP